MPQSPDEMTNAMIANFKDKTGKSLDQWIAIAKSCGAIEIAPKKAYVSHRVRLEKETDVDKDIKVWIKKAWSEA
jgi:hypothetical protein